MKLLWLTLLISKLFVFTHHHQRGAGKDFYGHTTSRFRRTTWWVRPEYTRLIPEGIFRRWREVQVGFKRLVCLVAHHGGLLWTPAVTMSRPGTSYISSSPVRPLPPEVGNRFATRYVPVGVIVSNLDFYARAAGTGVKILRHRDHRVEVRLPSKKQLWLEDTGLATIGANPNAQAKHLHYTKAGHRFVLGRRPHNRGVTMNPVDHPNGGGQGKTSGGGPSVSPWGQLAKGYKTV